MPVRKVVEIEVPSDSDDFVEEVPVTKKPKKDFAAKPKSKSSAKKDASGARFVGSPISKAEATRRWPERYADKTPKKQALVDENGQKQKPSSDDGDEEHQPGQCAGHYARADVDGMVFELGDCVYVNAGDGPDYIGRVIEFFKTVDNELWFRTQWFFRAQDTAIGDKEGCKHDPKRVFYSEVKDFNPLDCIVSKLKIVRLSPCLHFNVPRSKPLPQCDYYYDMGYDYAYSRFYVLSPEAEGASSESDVTNCNELSTGQASSGHSGNKSDAEVTSGSSKEYTLLDLYSGCGGMSTGLCMGAHLSSVRLVTKWALDLNEFACKSLKHNHPETEVRNEAAEDFLILLKEWKKLCSKYCKREDALDHKQCGRRNTAPEVQISDDENDDATLGRGVYEVEKLVGIRHVGSLEADSDDDAKNTKTSKCGVEFKVRWKGYGPSDDTWEPLDGLGSCEESLKRFVIEGHKRRILPLPGDVDVVCGGPPCQGASGFNRFRNREDPLADKRNKQVIVYMDIVDFLKPKYILMENVVDILKFCGGILGRYALSRLVQMHYQATLGMMVAGCYGLPQFRMRVFLWGASPFHKLPGYPLPLHEVVQKGGIPQEWERNMVAYDELNKPKLLKALTLGDAISDLPPVMNSESRDEISYQGGAKTDFQRFIRLPKEVLTGACSLTSCKKQKLLLYDHHPLRLNTDDYQRTCRIPKEKGANFRNLPGVIMQEDNTVALDPNMERVMLPSGKPLVPDYAITFVKGRSPKPFGRLWWDETVPTVVTRAEPHNQIILHPIQDRVLTIRENARLQGFPDYYKLFGPVKQKYIQVGNAVAVPVGRALGYSLGLAIRDLSLNTPFMELPKNFPQGLMMSAQQISDMPLEAENGDEP